MNSPLAPAWLVALAAVASAASAQVEPSGWTIALDYGPGQNSLSPRNPSVRVTLRAYFPSSAYALAGVRLDARAGEQGWAAPTGADILSPMRVGASPGANAGPDRVGIVAGQLHFPPAGIFADPANPMPVWSALWTTADFRPRDIPLSTGTDRFDVYESRTTPIVVPVQAPFLEGAAVIHILPSPAAVTPLLAALAARRRRR